MISFILIIIAAIFYPGIINKIKSIVSGRKGPSVIQPIMDLFKLLRKGNVYSNVSSIIFQIMPIIYLSIVLIVTLIMPVGNFKGFFSFDYDFVLFVYLMGLSRFFVVIASLDTGSSFSAMGASRENVFGLLAEPILFIFIATTILLTGKTSFYEIFANISNYDYSYLILSFGGILVIFMLMLIENYRVPVDDPKTHLELTMIHEVMILDYSGIDLAFITLASQIKMAIFGTLIFNVISNFFIDAFHIPIYFLTQFFVALIIGLVESFISRLKLNNIPQFIMAITGIIFIIMIVIILNIKLLVI